MRTPARWAAPSAPAALQLAEARSLQAQLGQALGAARCRDWSTWNTPAENVPDWVLPAVGPALTTRDRALAGVQQRADRHLARLLQRDEHAGPSGPGTERARRARPPAGHAHEHVALERLHVEAAAEYGRSAPILALSLSGLTVNRAGCRAEGRGGTRVDVPGRVDGPDLEGVRAVARASPWCTGRCTRRTGRRRGGTRTLMPGSSSRSERGGGVVGHAGWAGRDGCVGRARVDGERTRRPGLGRCCRRWSTARTSKV